MTTPALRVAFCCNTAFGVANFRSGVIRSLLQRGHRVIVVAPEDEEYSEQLRALGAEFVPWAVSGRSASPLGELSALRGLVRIYAELRPDLAFHFTIKAVIYGAIAGRLNRVPFVSVITGLGYVFLNAGWVSRISRALYANTLKWSREVWFLNDDDRESFERLGLLRRVRVRILPGEGVDMQHFGPVPLPCTTAQGHVVIFLMVARLLKDKGVLEYIEAARILRRAHANARCQLLGPADADNPSAISRSQVDGWVAEGIVEYLGVARDVRLALAGADCIVLPSYREGMPRSLLEGAAMARAVVTTDVPGCRDVVVAGETGLLCRVRDPADLASRLNDMVSLGAEQLVEMGQRGRRLVTERFDESIVIEHYLAALSSLR